MSQIPLHLRNKLILLPAVLSEEIVGQQKVIDRITPWLQGGELGISRTGRPKSSFLFLGPSGVGKTQLTIEFTDYLFGSGHLIRLDMSEFQHPASIDRLLGTATAESLLASKLARVASGTILLDEIEKAHPSILDLLLQILDTACLTLADGSRLDFSAFYVVLTSNIASQAIATAEQRSGSALEAFVELEAQRYLRPELVARLDEVLVFRRLGDGELQQIMIQFAEAEAKRLEQLGVFVDVKQASIRAVSSFSGARGMKGAVTRALRMQALEILLGRN